MNKRAKKIQKRNAKKKAAKRQVNQVIESELLALKEVKRYQAMCVFSSKQITQ